MGRKSVSVTLNTGADDIWNTDNPSDYGIYKDGILAGTMDMNHQDLILTEKAPGERRFELVFMPIPTAKILQNFFHLTAALSMTGKSQAQAMMWKVPFEAAELLSEENLDRIEVMKF